MVQFNQKEAIIGADISDSDNNSTRIYVKITKENKRYLIINDKPVKTFRSLKQLCHVDYLSEDVIRIFTESPEIRRHVLDDFLSEFHSDYQSTLRRYQKVIRQKNHLLKQNPSLDEIGYWNTQLVSLAVPIIQYRLDVIKLFNQGLNELIKDIDCPLFNHIEIKYNYKSLKEDDAINHYQSQLEKELEKRAEKEKIVGYSLVGPHRDDFIVVVDQRSLFTFFSRGINRFVAILLKIVQIKQRENKETILLLDDTFAELDMNTKELISKAIAINGQVFLTSVINEDKQLFNNATTLNMKKGRITQLEDNER